MRLLVLDDAWADSDEPCIGGLLALVSIGLDVGGEAGNKRVRCAGAAMDDDAAAALAVVRCLLFACFGVFTVTATAVGRFGLGSDDRLEAATPDETERCGTVRRGGC